MIRRRKSEGFNLAFLDIMSCGLGAIVLVFMMVKYDVESAVVETDLLKNDLMRLEAQKYELRSMINAQAQAEGAAAGDVAAISQRIAALQAEMARLDADAAAQAAQKSALEKSIETTVIPEKPDVVEVPRGGEENYIIGLTVEGSKIGILIDTSSSMTDEKLLDVIRRKNMSDVQKKAGPKWRRTKAIAKWIVARAPQASDLRVIGFGKQAANLDGGAWFKSGEARAVAQVVAKLEAAVPEGPTNLEAGLRAMEEAGVTNLYIVTDGLPTDGASSYKSLNPFADCSALWGASSTISGVCRMKLFTHTVGKATLRNVRVNVILLPIEGDPEAANAFWRWTSSTGGITLSPADTWP